jgi:hypothetical protein
MTHDQILEYDFKALVGGHIRRYGTREDVLAAREYFHDMLGFAAEVLREMSNAETAMGYQKRGAGGPSYIW